MIKKILVDNSINETHVIKFGRKALNLAGNLLKVIHVLEGRLHTDYFFRDFNGGASRETCGFKSFYSVLVTRLEVISCSTYLKSLIMSQISFEMSSDESMAMNRKQIYCLPKRIHLS